MFEFDLQRFDEETATEQTADTGDRQTAVTEKEELPEELNGLPEDIARETYDTWKASQSTEEAQPEQSARAQQQTEESVPYARFKEKVDEANQLKAQLAEYQRRMQQQPAPQQQPPRPQQPAQQQLKITPEIAKKINEAVDAEAMAMSGLSQKDVEELDYVDDDDPRLGQWKQAKQFAQDKVFNAIREAQMRQLQQQQQAQQSLAIQQAALNDYHDYTRKEIETVRNFKDVQNFAANEFFEQQPPAIKNLVATSYLHAEQRIATPSELFVVRNFYEQAKAAFNARANGAKQPVQRSAQAASLPRADQLKGASSMSDGQLSANEIEKLLRGDFTKIDPKKQRIMLGLT